MRLGDFDFPLPEELIAQHPTERRDGSRLMVVRRGDGGIEHAAFTDLPGLLSSPDLLVWNRTRVIPARLRATLPGSSTDVEILLVRDMGGGRWLALVKPGRRARTGQELRIGPLRAEVEHIREDGSRVLSFEDAGSVSRVVESLGVPPLPPYIRRTRGHDWAEDRNRYQTIYAREPGSVAAPTAGLHFTPEVVQMLGERGIRRTEILLHVGYGTFKPVRTDRIEDHQMEPEAFEIDQSAVDMVTAARAKGGRVVAVGTTTTRALETVAAGGPLRPTAGESALFIHPGFQFRVIDALLTNFHLPKSTLFMLVCAFAGRDLMLESYRIAVERRYRFFSYGDCMLLL